MTPDQRQTDIIRSFTALSDSLVDDFDIIDLTTRLTEDCARLLDVAAAGLLLADARGVMHLLAATSEQTRNLELFQLQRDEGPCLDCYRSGRYVGVADLHEELDRWPRFAPAAAAAGFASVHAIPLRLRQEVLGTLGLFGAATGPLTPDDRELAQALAHVATLAIVHDNRTTDQAAILARLRMAVTSRGLLEMAKGVLAEEHGLDMDAAFARLRHYARAHEQGLTEVARAVVSGPPARRVALLAALGEPDPAY